MIDACDCPPDGLRGLARSNLITVSRCANCGTYWLTSPLEPEPRPADGDALALCELVESLARVKLPDALGMRRVSTP